MTTPPVLRGSGVPYYVQGLALGIPVYLVAIHFWTWVLTAPVFLSGRADFRQLYAACYMVRTGKAGELYDYEAQKEFQDKFVSHEQAALPFVSPAYEALIFVPLSCLSYRRAYLVFLALNTAALGVIFCLLHPWMRDLDEIYKWLGYAIFGGFLPVAAALIQGQDSIILTALLAAAFVLLVRGRDTAAGCMLGLGMFKFQIVLPITLLFFVWKRGRFLLGFSLSAFAVLTTSVLLVGAAETKLYIGTLFSIAGFKPPSSGLAGYPISLGAMANLHGLVFGILSRHCTDCISMLTLVLSAAVFCWTALRGIRPHNTSRLLLLTIPCSVLVGHHTYIHDLSVLLVPIVVMLGSFLHCEHEASSDGCVIARSAALMFVAPVVESFAPNYFFVVSIAVLFLLASIARAEMPVA